MRFQLHMFGFMFIYDLCQVFHLFFVVFFFQKFIFLLVAFHFFPGFVFFIIKREYWRCCALFAHIFTFLRAICMQEKNKNAMILFILLLVRVFRSLSTLAISSLHSTLFARLECFCLFCSHFSPNERVSARAHSCNTICQCAHNDLNASRVNRSSNFHLILLRAKEKMWKASASNAFRRLN